MSAITKGRLRGLLKTSVISWTYPASIYGKIMGILYCKQFMKDTSHYLNMWIYLLNSQIYTCTICDNEDNSLTVCTLLHVISIKKPTYHKNVCSVNSIQK